VSRALKTRLAKLEAQQAAPQEHRRVHQIAAYSDQEQAEKVAELIASGAACESDFFIVLRPLQP
jgi:hypothetical protein